MNEKQIFLRPLEFAQAARLGRSKVYEMIQRGQLPHVRIGGLLRIPASVLDEFTRQAMAAAEEDRADPE